MGKKSGRGGRGGRGGKAPRGKGPVSSSSSSSSSSSTPSRESLVVDSKIDSLVSNCNATGQLAIQEQARDIKFVNFSLSSHGVPLIADTTLELNYGRRYGLIGRNGSGKTTFMRVLGAREIEIPTHIDVYLLSEEMDPTEKTAMEAVVDYGLSEVKRLESLESQIIEEHGPENQILMDIYERLDELVSLFFSFLSSLCPLIYFLRK